MVDVIVKPNVDVIEAVLPPEDALADSSEPTHFQQAMKEEIDFEMLNNDMQFECVGFKLNRVAVAIFFTIFFDFTGGIQVSR